MYEILKNLTLDFNKDPFHDNKSLTNFARIEQFKIPCCLNITNQVSIIISKVRERQNFVNAMNK